MSLTEMQQVIVSVADKAGASVVGIGRNRRGTGIVISEGKVLTNAHNLRGEQVTVSFPDGRTETGSVSGADLDADLAVVAVDTGDTTPLTWAPNGGVSLGSPVVALANPAGMGLRVTVGFVSGTGRTFRGPRGRAISGSLEHTAPLLPGASGGPVVDVDGQFVGLNTNRLGEGFYLAIPADDELRSAVERLSSGQTSTRPRLGVGVAPAAVARKLRQAVGLPDAEGVLVRMVFDDGPAAAAGIRQGDLITRVGGQALTDPDDLYQVLDGIAPGSVVSVSLLRGVEELSVEVTFGEA
ncbi:MAG TPA: S1C family serine protease [Acidimicrobiia bacterium]|jgi:serine protease Do|nr:S1C family serine protease [Acidimicrobiia bacterium]